jgi:uncharacterized protein (TIGR03437 family)
MLCRFTFFLICGSLVAQIPFTQFVVFGDSLSDNGNLYIGTSLLGDPTPGPPLYATGEYTDGTNSVPTTSGPLGLWIEQLATKMNLPVPQPYAKGGTNYAVASALTGMNPAYSPTTLSVPWLTDQLKIFLAANHIPPVNALYTFWGGANDILGGVNPVTAVSNIQGNIDTLATAGAKYFFWANIPAVGEVPEAINTSNRFPLDAASVAYNNAWTLAIAQLKAAHPGITIVAYDAYSTTLTISQNPAQYGFVNVTSPAQGLASVNPNTYFFWDMLHPTTAVNADVATAAYTAIESVFGVMAPSSSPLITSVGNAFSNSAIIAPNTWVAIKGTSLSPTGDSRIWQASDFVGEELPTALDGVRVTINGETVYVYYISPTQLNILTPADLSPGTAQVQVTNNGLTSTAFSVQAQAYSLAFFVFNGGPYVIGTHLNGSIVGPMTLYPGASTPAQPGEEVVLYATGFGGTTSAIVNGSLVQSGTLPVMPVIQIGGVSATVIFAGLVLPGLFQFNAFVPASAANRDNTLTAQYSGQSTQSGVLLTVQSNNSPSVQSATPGARQ